MEDRRDACLGRGTSGLSNSRGRLFALTAGDGRLPAPIIYASLAV